MLWGKNKEEKRAAAMESDHQEDSREQGDADARSCSSPAILKEQNEEKEEVVGKHKNGQHV